MSDVDNLRAFTNYVVCNRRQMVPEMTPRKALEALAVSNAFGGEAGELQNIVKKIIREDAFLDYTKLHDEFVLEAGDALHYLISLITLFGYTPEVIMKANIKKLDERRRSEKENIHAEITA